jgi:hypothetical protein
MYLYERSHSFGSSLSIRLSSSEAEDVSGDVIKPFSYKL